MAGRMSTVTSALRSSWWGADWSVPSQPIADDPAFPRTAPVLRIGVPAGAHGHAWVHRNKPGMSGASSASYSAPGIDLTHEVSARHARTAHSGEAGPRSRAAASAVMTSTNGGTPDNPAGVTSV